MPPVKRKQINIRIDSKDLRRLEGLHHRTQPVATRSAFTHAVFLAGLAAAEDSPELLTGEAPAGTTRKRGSK